MSLKLGTFLEQKLARVLRRTSNIETTQKVQTGRQIYMAILNSMSINLAYHTKAAFFLHHMLHNHSNSLDGSMDASAAAGHGSADS